MLMAGGFYTHFALNDAFERMAPSLIFSLLIVCRLIILYQVNKKERKDEELVRKLLEEVQEQDEASLRNEINAEGVESSSQSEVKKDK